MEEDRARLMGAALGAAAGVALLWWIAFLADLAGWDLGGLGVVPRTEVGLIGILTAPLVHGSFEHLLANSPPLLVLGALLLYGYPRARWPVLALLWLGGGALVWAFGRPSSHIGASGIGHGLMFFLFVSGLLRRDRLAVAISMVAFFLYGGMVWGIFPREEHVSWEFHLAGAALGILAAAALGRLDPLPPEPRFAWEDEDHDDPVIGDQWRWRRAPPPDAEGSEEFPIAGDDDFLEPPPSRDEAPDRQDPDRGGDGARPPRRRR
jgi:membrane associated rhomboid family serine protease